MTTIDKNKPVLVTGATGYVAGGLIPIPRRALPKWLLLIVGPAANKLFTRTVIRNNVNVPFRADNSKIKREPGMNFLPIRTTMEDSFQVLVDEKMIS